MTMPAKEAFSVTSVYTYLWNVLFSYFRVTLFLFDLKVLFVIELALPSADIEKLVSSSLDDEVIVDHSRGHLCELILSSKSNLNEL